MQSERFAQYHEGIPVYGADLIRQTDAGVTTAILGTLFTAVAEFVERYNPCWRLEKLAYRTPSEARAVQAETCCTESAAFARAEKML